MKKTLLYCAMGTILSVHSAVEFTVTSAQGSSVSVLDKQNTPIQFFSVENESGEEGLLFVSLVRETSSGAALSFVSRAIHADKSVRSSSPITALLNYNEPTSVLFDVMQGGILLILTVKPL